MVDNIEKVGGGLGRWRRRRPATAQNTPARCVQAIRPQAAGPCLRRMCFAGAGAGRAAGAAGGEDGLTGQPGLCLQAPGGGAPLASRPGGRCVLTAPRGSVDMPPRPRPPLLQAPCLPACLAPPFAGPRRSAPHVVAVCAHDVGVHRAAPAGGLCHCVRRVQPHVQVLSRGCRAGLPIRRAEPRSGLLLS
jgi:hypothetical protein